jgi:hypothetical protein
MNETATANPEATANTYGDPDLRLVSRRIPQIEHECNFMPPTSIEEGMGYDEFLQTDHKARTSPCARELLRKIRRKSGVSSIVPARFEDLSRETGEEHLLIEEIINARHRNWHHVPMDVMLRYVARCSFHHLQNIHCGTKVIFCMEPVLYKGEPSVLMAYKGRLFNEFNLQCASVHDPLDQNSIMVFVRK